MYVRTTKVVRAGSEILVSFRPDGILGVCKGGVGAVCVRHGRQSVVRRASERRPLGDAVQSRVPGSVARDNKWAL